MTSSLFSMTFFFPFSFPYQLSSLLLYFHFILSNIYLLNAFALLVIIQDRSIQKQGHCPVVTNNLMQCVFREKETWEHTCIHKKLLENRQEYATRSALVSQGRFPRKDKNLGLISKEKLKRETEDIRILGVLRVW